ncbi:MAG: CdaR family protein [Bacteroidales bacterium]
MSYRRKIVHSYLLLKKKVGLFIKRKNNKELLTFSFFLLLSFFFWTLQVLREEITTSYTIHLEVTDIPKNILITSKIPVLEVKLRDQGADLFNLYRKENVPVTVPFSPKDVKSGRYTLSPEDILSIVQKRITGSAQIISVYPNSLVLYFSIGQSKQLPIKINGDFQTKQQYMVSGEIVTDPEMITAYAPEDLLAKLDECETDSLFLQNLSETYTTEVAIKPVSGVKFYPDKVKLEVPVESFTQKELQVPFTIMNLPEDKTLRTFPANAAISCFVALSKYNQMKNNEFSVVIDYKDIQNEKQKKVKVNLNEYPVYVSNVQLLNDSVEFIIEDKIIHD